MIIVLGVIFAIVAITGLALGETMFIWIGLGIVVVVGFFVAPLFKQADAMFASGQIIKRDADFMKNSQTFTISRVGMDALIAAIKDKGLPYEGLEWRTGDGVMTFKSRYWEAQMIKLDSDDNCDKWQFTFLSWEETKYGSAISHTEMNAVMTAVEKAFIALDPNTKVQTERIKVNTNSRFL